MKKILLFISLLTVSCSSYTQITMVNGHIGYEYSCDRVSECDSVANNLCDELSFRIITSRKSMSGQYKYKIECVDNDVDWGKLSD